MQGSLQRIKVMDGATQHLYEMIRAQSLQKVPWLQKFLDLIAEEFHTDSILLDRNLSKIAQNGFDHCPPQLQEEDETSGCLSQVVPLLKRQFLQEKPIIPPEKAQSLYHFSAPISPKGGKPDYILILRFKNGQRILPDSFAELIRFLELQLNFFSLSEQEDKYYHFTLQTLIKTIEAKSPLIFEHCERVSQYCLILSKVMKLNATEAKILIDGAKIHDIGYIHIPRSILHKPGGLSDAEKVMMRRGVTSGYKILSSSEFPIFDEIARMIYTHSENMDGSGYPRGLKESQIPRVSRILSIANAYDAMTSVRPYQRALNAQEAIEELKRCSGMSFDPKKTRKPHSCLQFDSGVVEKFIDYLLEHNADI